MVYLFQNIQGSTKLPFNLRDLVAAETSSQRSSLQRVQFTLAILWLSCLKDLFKVVALRISKRLTGNLFGVFN